MSLKPDAIRALAEVDPHETLVIPTGSGNRYGDDCTDSDCESGLDWRDELDEADIVARFWAKVNKNGPIPSHRPELGPCWLWTASRNNGYGQFTLPRVNGNQPHAYAHRFAWELAHGRIRAAKPYICHACDEPLCCRASHLFAGTQYDNLTDARRKGRLNNRLPRPSETFTPEQRLAIYNLPARPGLTTALAKQYGVTKTCISHIRHGRFTRPIPAGERVPHIQLEPVPFRRLEVRGQVA